MRPAEQCAVLWEDLSDGRLEVWKAVYETDREQRRRSSGSRRFRLGDVKTGVARSLVVPSEGLHALDRQRHHVETLRGEGRLSAEAARYVFPNRTGTQPFTNPAGIYDRWR